MAENEKKGKSKVKMLIDLYEDGRRFMLEELWTKDTSTLSAMKRFLFSLCRIIMIVGRGFQEDNCSLQASALTYITLVSLVPMLAIMFSFSKGLGMQSKILSDIGLERRVIVADDGSRSWEYKIAEYKPLLKVPAPAADASETKPEAEQAKTDEQAKPDEQPKTEEQAKADEKPKTEEQAKIDEKPAAEAPQEAVIKNHSRTEADALLAQKLPPPMQQAIIKIFEYVDHTSFAALGLIGSIMLLFSVIGSMSKLENSFNQIWGVKKPRNFMRKCSEYLVVLILVPIIFIVMTSLNTVLLSNKFVLYLNAHFGQVAMVIQFIVRFTGYIFVLCGFGFFYMFMPNTKVKAFPGIIAGLISGLLWFGVQWAYLHLQVGLTKFNSIYGTFAVLPFFLAWLYANWSIILLGAEISFAVQNHRTIHIEKASEDATTGICIVLGQLLLFEACKSFHDGKGPWSPTEFGMEKNIPTRIIRHVVDVLSKAGILLRIQTEEAQSEMFLPGRDISMLSPADVEEAFRGNQSLNTKLYLHALPRTLRERYQQIYENYTASLSAMTFDKIVADNAEA